jgi:hypothetical protein
MPVVLWAVLPPGPLAPAWFVFPMAFLALLVLAAHVAGLSREEMPDSRRRIRTVNGVLMMFTTPLLAYAFGLADPARPRVFVIVWVLVAGLVTLILFLALSDMLNTWRLNALERRELRRQLELGKQEAAALARSQAAPVPHAESKSPDGGHGQ